LKKITEKELASKVSAGKEGKEGKEAQ